MNYQTQDNTVARAIVELVSRGLGLESKPVTYQPKQGRRALFDGMSFRDIALICAEEAPNVGNTNPDFIARAMATSDFPAILADVANKQLETIHKSRPGSFLKWAAKGTLQDYKQTSISRLIPPGALPEIGESAEFTHLKIEDSEEMVRMKTFGGILSISRHAIINDDLNAFTDRTRILSQTANVTQSKTVTGALIANKKLSDGVEVFHAGRGNLLTGGTSALSADSLAAAVAAVRRFANGNGEPLLIEPKYLVVGPGNERLAYQLAYSNSDPSAANSGAANFFKTIGLEVIVDPLLESSSITGGSLKAWYLLPDPELTPVIRYFTFPGSNSLAPFIEGQTQWNNDALEMKVRTDFAAAPTGFFAVKATGE